MAASIALPPWRMMSTAICVASGWLVAAMACGARTAERVAKGSPVTRSAAIAQVIEINWPVRNAPAQQVPIRIIIIPEIVEHER